MKPVGWRAASRVKLALLEVASGSVGFGETTGEGRGDDDRTVALGTGDAVAIADGEPDDGAPPEAHALVRMTSITKIAERAARVFFMWVRRTGWSYSVARIVSSRFPLYLSVKRAPVAQRTERVASDHQVAGSIPAGRATSHQFPFRWAVVAYRSM